VIEHNLDVIKTADWLVDMGPEGGSRGGMVVAEGTPEAVAADPDSYTGQFLAPLLEGRAAKQPTRKVAPKKAPTPPPTTKAAKKAAEKAAAKKTAAKKTAAKKTAAKKTATTKVAAKKAPARRKAS
jgi:excinuclease ABC subunit A